MIAAIPILMVTPKLSVGNYIQSRTRIIARRMKNKYAILGFKQSG
jgi:hypothetical protein